jgi:hypothetical protein
MSLAYPIVLNVELERVRLDPYFGQNLRIRRSRGEPG